MQISWSRYEPSSKRLHIGKYIFEFRALEFLNITLKERNLFKNAIFSTPPHPPEQLRLLQSNFWFQVCSLYKISGSNKTM